MPAVVFELRGALRPNRPQLLSDLLGPLLLQNPGVRSTAEMAVYSPSG